MVNKDPKKEYLEEMQKVMLELKLKTDKFMEKLKEQNQKSKFGHNIVK